MLIRYFRGVVLKKDSDAISSIIDAIKGDMYLHFCKRYFWFLLPQPQELLGRKCFPQEDEKVRLSSLLLDRSSAEPTKEALLTAICIGNRPLVELILSLFYEFPEQERNGCRHSIAFPPHMTPLMLASICNNFAIVQCLLLRNHRINLPHRPDCLCSECRRIARGLSKGVVTLDTYRAISSAAFLWLACSDPPLAAFRLAADLEVCGQCDQEYRFLSTLNAQSAVHAEWCGGWTDYGNDPLQDTFRHIKHMLLYPIGAFLHTITAGLCVKSFNYPLASKRVPSGRFCLLARVWCSTLALYHSLQPWHVSMTFGGH
ncbi:unnamed protein product, partial [Toxocara canis]|uniref:TRP_2 domain-containing protein n=1 Tax=Toxocara canis TaxID=6265 RepID=A0A183U173_TOXCA